MKISAKRQVSIPKKIMETMKLEIGDEVDFEIKSGVIQVTPIKTIKVPRDQAWFWTAEWQQKERQANQNLADGEYNDFDNIKDLLKDLHNES